MTKDQRSYFKSIIATLVILALVLTSLSSSCYKVSAATNEEVAFQIADHRKINKGESYNFNLVNKKKGSKYTWSSSNPSVATVNNKGVVKGVEVGNATITCKITKEDKVTELKARVYVKEASQNPATNVTIHNKISSMAPGEVYNLNRTYTPKEASEFVNWTSSNTKVATVDKRGVVLAKSSGTVTIEVTTLNGKVKDRVTIKISNSVTVTSQKDMERLLVAENATTLNLKTKSEQEIVIPKGDYSNKKLIVDAPNTTVKNHGVFEAIEIRNIKQNSWYEYVKGNIFNILANVSVFVEEGASATFSINGTNCTINFINNGEISITVNQPSNLHFDGNPQAKSDVIVNSKNVKLHTKLPLHIRALEIVLIELQSQIAANTTFEVDNENILPVVQGTGTIHGKVGGKDWTLSEIKNPNQIPTSIPTASPTITPTDPEVPRVPVDKNGFDSQGRVVAYFGTPVVDGEIDAIWKQAEPVAPIISSGETTTKATFKILWDDNGIFFLAEVKDANLSAENANVYERDSVEFFLDENNDKTVAYGPDDLQFRANYLNQQSVDHGDLVRFYTSTKTVDGGYIIEGRVALTQKPENNKVLGMEMQVNDAKEGKRIATLNLFDKTGNAFQDTSKFGAMLLTGKKSGAVSGLNPYDLIALVNSAKEIELFRYSNGDVVEDLVLQAEALIADKAATQKQVDDLYSQLEKAIKALVHSDESFDEKECRQVPKEYKEVPTNQGTIEQLYYNTSTYGDNPQDIEKYLNVYLPYGYDQNDTTKKYDVFYLIHGMSENQNTVFEGPGKNSELKRIVDNMIINGQIEPMIIVTPTWYVEGNTDMFYLVKNFHNELINDILPLIEGRYNTYSESTNAEDLIAARDHRAFGGFSMGAGCTWYNYIYAIDYFKYYVPVSLWCLEDVSQTEYEGTNDEKMAQYLADVAIKAGYTKDDIRIFCATGTDDMAYGGMVSQIEAMKKLDYIFKYSADLRKGNFYFLALEGGTHIWNCVNRYLYNILPDLFESADDNDGGLDDSGRAVAPFGSPVVDGKVDSIWSRAKAITPPYNTSSDGTTATFKVMWDDNALYVLSQVKDNNLSVESGTPYMQDSMEVFMDENNDKTQEFGIDDVQFRVNYQNSKTADKGDISRFYTKTSTVEGGYIIEARIALKDIPVNQKVLGLELQINDAKDANRVGTLNVFDATGSAWNDTSKFGNVVLVGRTADSVTGINPYNLLSLIDSVKNMDLTDYRNPSVVTDAIVVAEEVLAKENVTQEEIDGQFAAIQIAIASLILTDEAANEKRYVPVPTNYKGENERTGTIVTLTYDAPNTTGTTDAKKMNIYLPYGYDAADTETKYNVFYLMHGGGENEDTIFGGAGQSRELKRILDNMIANGDIEPMIVVTPTSNGGANDVAKFHEELINIIVPKVETTYNTYAGTGSDEELKASRDHRAFGGFSMGSVCTWYVYIHCIEYFKYYLPISGDCWQIEGGASKSKETAEFLAQVAKNAGYGPRDFFLFCATGSEDIAYPNVKPQIDEMKKLTDIFVYSSDITKGNFYFLVAEGGTHAWSFVNQYIYNILPDVFN